MADHREIGAFQVNGQWATQIAYEASVRAGRVSEVALTFMNRRSQVAAFQGDREQVLSILGERNLAAIESGAGAHDDKVKGRLGGATLHYRAVVLPHAASGETQEAQPRDAENAIERDSLHRQSERDDSPQPAVRAAAATPAAACAADRERSTPGPCSGRAVGLCHSCGTGATVHPGQGPVLFPRPLARLCRPRHAAHRRNREHRGHPQPGAHCAGPGLGGAAGDGDREFPGQGLARGGAARDRGARLRPLRDRARTARAGTGRAWRGGGGREARR